MTKEWTYTTTLSFWDLCAYVHHSTKVTKLDYHAFLFEFN